MIRIERIKNSKSSYEIGFFLNIDCKYKFIVIGISFIKGLEFVIRWGTRERKNDTQNNLRITDE